MPLIAPKDITFNVYEDEDGGYYAAADGYSIFTQGDDWDDLKYMVRDAVLCHFDEGSPETIRLHLSIKQEITAA